MYSEFIRQQHSIDAIISFKQVEPSYKLIRLFEAKYRDVQGVQEKTQMLINQLKEIEL